MEISRETLDNALADYDAALSIEPRMAVALYGRAVTKRRKGDVGGSDADFAAAKTIRPNVADYMRRYAID